MLLYGLNTGDTMRKFKKVKEHAQLFGVCGGLAYMLEIPAWVVRVGLLLSVLCFGIGILPYIIVGLVAPQWDTDPADYAEVCNE